ncbi:hypothetical protein HBZS_118020 [Helicobacter bizzozeronii CCUG 35545]|nr:hypothetical protein HBZS_118020 [Helicobacter bizzozeronii CCUG 35545]
MLLSLGTTTTEIKKTFFYLGSVIGGGGSCLRRFARLFAHGHPL